MSFILLQAREESNFRTTSGLISRLITLSIETTFVAVAVASAQLIAYLRFPGMNYDLAFLFIQCPVYANILLTVLSKRRELRRLPTDNVTSGAIRAAVGSIDHRASFRPSQGEHGIDNLISRIFVLPDRHVASRKSIMVVGFAAYWFFIGVYLMQLWNYFTLYGLNDPLFIRVILLIVFCAMIVYTMAVVGISWRFVDPNLGPTSPLPKWANVSSPMIGLVASSIHAFFAWWEFGVRYHGYITMAYILLEARAQSSFKTTSRLIFRLLMLSIETAFPTVAIAAAQLMVYLKYPGETGKNSDLALLFINFTAYVNLLMAVLNKRKELRNLSTDNVKSGDIHAAVGMSTQHVSAGMSPSQVDHRGINNLASRFSPAESPPFSRASIALVPHSSDSNNSVVTVQRK
ncbi:hypothetical protein BDQ17DRAFT_1430553 [Cyathus striatus]|nr:hypothetical protein BDQ17DRAFT_1430553 [Cyathus striatus]